MMSYAPYFWESELESRKIPSTCSKKRPFDRTQDTALTKVKSLITEFGREIAFANYLELHAPFPVSLYYHANELFS